MALPPLVGAFGPLLGDEPARWFPAVARGDVEAQPLRTPPFQELAALIRRLTRETGEDYAGWSAKLMAAWRRLEAAYPREAIQYAE